MGYRYTINQLYNVYILLHTKLCSCIAAYALKKQRNKMLPRMYWLPTRNTWEHVFRFIFIHTVVSLACYSKERLR